MKPKVSVIMPAYNAAKYIHEAIKSILEQTFTDFELIIINDGSSDETLDCIKSFSDPRIKLINNEKNLGIIKSRNIGLDAASGEYIAKMDADDVSLPSRLQRQVNYLDQHQEVAVIATKLAIINSEGILTTVWPEDYYVTTIAQINSILPRTNCIGQPTVMMRAALAKSIRYNEKYKYNEDWGMWLDVRSRKLKIAKLDEVLLHYRVHTMGTTVKENTKNVEVKTIKFRLKYLAQNVFSPSQLLYRLAIGLIIDVLKYLTPGFLRKVFKFIKLRPLEVLGAYLKVKKQISEAKGKVSHLFFFPFYHSGGAEKVHASILESVADKQPLAFITGRSGSKALFDDFKASANLAEVELLLQFGPSYRWLKKQIEELCRLNPELILFGCNSRFFYEALSTLPERTKAIDLIHAFVHEYEDGPEKWSIPVVQKLSKRVVISENTKNDLKLLYQKNKIDQTYLERTVCITNFIEAVPFTNKDNTGDLNVLYVGRGSSEKRIHLISGAARLCAEKKLPIHFHFAGDTNGFIPKTDLAFCKTHNEIHDPAVLNALYKTSNVLVIASSREGFPMVIMEAMINGVVPIATNVGGISSHITSNVNGILLTETDEQKIMESIAANLELLLSNKENLQRLSAAAYAYALDNFKKEVFFSSYRKLLS